MNASLSFAASLLKLILQNESIPGIGDTEGILGSAVAGNVYFRLCTDAVAVDAETIGAECAYTGYVAGGVAVARSAAALPNDDNEGSNAAEVVFGKCTAGTENARYLEIWMNGVGATEATRLFWFRLTQDEVNTDLPIAAGVQPKFAIGAFGLTVS